MYARSILAVVCFTTVTTFLATLPAAAAEQSGADAPKQVIDGKLTGFDIPTDWKLSERAKRLT